MGSAARLVRGDQQKQIVKIIEGMSGRRSAWEIWQDFIVMSALAISNSVDREHRETREQEYMNRAARYAREEMEQFPAMLALVVDAMEENPDQDFLGDLFMCLGLGDQWKGQFFTPYCICKAMAKLNSKEQLEQEIAEKGWISVNDPACGAGALLLAFANETRERGINYQEKVLFVGQDIDYLAGMMCYIQISLLGCPGYVVIGDTLAHPGTSLDERGLLPRPGKNVWKTPMFFRDCWAWRQIFSLGVKRSEQAEKYA